MVVRQLGRLRPDTAPSAHRWLRAGRPRPRLRRRGTAAGDVLGRLLDDVRDGGDDRAGMTKASGDYVGSHEQLRAATALRPEPLRPAATVRPAAAAVRAAVGTAAAGPATVRATAAAIRTAAAAVRAAARAVDPAAA